MKYFEWFMNAVSVMIIMCVVFLRLQSIGAIVSIVFAFSWLARYVWGDDRV